MIVAVFPSLTSPSSSANWTGELCAMLNREGLDISQSPISSSELSRLLARVLGATISGKIAKEVSDAMWKREGDADQIIERKGLKQISDASVIEASVDWIIAANPAQVAAYRAGKEKVFGFFVGQAMKAMGGKANPAQLNDLVRRKLAG